MSEVLTVYTGIIASSVVLWLYCSRYRNVGKFELTLSVSMFLATSERSTARAFWYWLTHRILSYWYY